MHKNKILFCFAGNFCLFFVGSEKINFSNAYGFKVDLSWLTIVSTAFALFNILYSINWTMAPIEKQTNKLIAMIAFIPLFLFRMMSWLLIIINLESFAIICIAFIAATNFLTLAVVQEELIVEPLEQTLLSLVFPVFKFPTVDLDDGTSLRILFWLSLSGNIGFSAIIAVLYIFYYLEINNPWCGTVKLLIPEEMFLHLLCLIGLLSVFSLLPIIMIRVFNTQRQVKLKSLQHAKVLFTNTTV